MTFRELLHLVNILVLFNLVSAVAGLIGYQISIFMYVVMDGLELFVIVVLILKVNSNNKLRELIFEN